MLRIRTVLAGVAATGLLAGCATAATPAHTTSAPGSGFPAAVAALGSGSTLAVTVHPDLTAAQLAELSAGGHKSDPAISNLLIASSLSVVVQAPAGESLAGLGAGGQRPDSSLAVDLGGADALDVRSDASTVYARIDPAAFAAIPAVRDALAHLPATVRSQPAVRAALAGGWVSLPMSALAMLPGASAAAPQAGVRLETGLLGVVTRDVVVTGGTGGVYTLTVNERRLATGLRAAFAAADPAASGRRHGHGQVPDRTVTMTATVTSGALSKLVIGLAQFAPPAERAGLHGADLQFDFARSAPAITFPSSATPVNLAALAPMLSGATTSTS
jgi:hypothetical protein